MRRRRQAGDVKLVRKFAVLSAVPIVLLGLILGNSLRTSIRSRALANAVQTGSILARVVVQPDVTRADLQNGISAANEAELDSDLRPNGTIVAGIARVKVWSSDGTVVYSDDHETIGQRFAVDGGLAEAVEGHVGSEISNLSGAENVADRHFGHLLEVYVPLTFGTDPGPAGAFEIYLPYQPIAAAITDDTNMVYGLLLAGLGLLYLILFRIVLSASRRLARQRAEHDYLALHDPLTDLPNRTLFHDRVGQAIETAKQTGTGVTVLILDLDQFKQVNDTLGHHTGDLLLQQLAARLRDAVRDVDTVAHLGGDEFAVLVPAVSEAAGAAVAGNVLAALGDPFTIAGLQVAVEASLGAAVYPDHGDNVDLLIQRADVAMYVAKDHKTGFERYSAGIDTYSPDRLVMLGELRRALAGNEMVLHYQPVAHLASGRITGVEALVRWDHPTRGRVQPDDFIPLAESTELIGPLTLWVLDHALAQCQAWDAQGFELDVAVNISVRNLHDRSFPAEVGALLAKWRLPANRVQLEITETAVMANPARAIDVLVELHDLGLSLAIDDFGTGYSSLSYLRRLPVAAIKIDKSFVTDMAADDNCAVIVRSTIDLGRNLGLGVIAEGVETSEVWDLLTERGCESAQGYFLSRPVAAQALSAWLVTRRSAPAVAAAAVGRDGGAAA